MDPMIPPRSLKAGPHQYSQRTWVGNIKLGATPETAFEALRRHATPFQGRVWVSDGDVTDIPRLGRVRHIVDRDRLTIVNATMEEHSLHPGSLFRSIVQEGDDLYVVTQGYGVGILPGKNEFVAPHLWRSVDKDIRELLDPSSMFDGLLPPKSPSGSDEPSAGRVRELKTLMGDRHSEYWKGPQAESLQGEYRRLMEMQERHNLTDDELWPTAMLARVSRET